MEIVCSPGITVHHSPVLARAFVIRGMQLRSHLTNITVDNMPPKFLFLHGSHGDGGKVSVNKFRYCSPDRAVNKILIDRNEITPRYFQSRLNLFYFVRAFCLLVPGRMNQRSQPTLTQPSADAPR